MSDCAYNSKVAEVKRHASKCLDSRYRRFGFPAADAKTHPELSPCVRLKVGLKPLPFGTF